jgi:hypothetical protein
MVATIVYRGGRHEFMVAPQIFFDIAGRNRRSRQYNFIESIYGGRWM